MPAGTSTQTASLPVPSAGFLSAGWPAATGLALLIALGYLALTPWTTLWDRDEPRFAGAAVEMVQSGQYLYPTFNGELRPQKPIFIYWLMALSIRTFGVSEIAVRGWSALGIGLAALFTYGIGRRLRSHDTGLVAMIVLATTPLAMVEGAAATTDAVFLAAMTGAIAAFVPLLTEQATWRHLVPLTITLAIAQLTKGPVGVVVPAAVMLAALWIARRGVAHARSAASAVILAAIASVAIFLAWAIPADAAAGGRLLSVGIGREVVGRALRPVDGHGVPATVAWAFYPLVIAVGFSPWTAFLPRAIARLRADRSRPARRALLISWLLVPATLFTIAATKLPHYVLPMWPALALTVAMTLAEASRDDERWDRFGRWILAAIVVLELLVLIGVMVVAPLPALRPPLVVLSVIALAAAIPLWTSRRRALDRRDAVVWAACGVAAQIAASAWLLPALEALKPVPRIAEAIRRHSPPSEPIFTYEFEEPSLVFYSARVPVVALRSDDHAFAWVRQPGPGVLVTTRSAAERLARRPGTGSSLREIAAASGIDVVKGKRVDLVALQKLKD